MNTVLIYDTETTGLPKWNLPSEDPSQPRITQLAAELLDEDTGVVLAGINFLIKPNGWTIPDDVAEITGITTERAEKYGFPIDVVLPLFMNMWKQTNVYRVAHNESFDMRMIRIEMMRDKSFSRFADDWKMAPAFCTCTSSTAIVNLPPTEKMRASGRNTPKPPNLAEAYRFFTGLELEGAHNAANDIAGCKAVYQALRRGQTAAAAA